MITDKTLLIVVAIFLLISILGGTYYWFRKRRHDKKLKFKSKPKTRLGKFLATKHKPYPNEDKLTLDITTIGIFIGAIAALFFLFIQKAYLSLGIILFGIGLYLLVAWFYSYMNGKSIAQFKILSQDLGIKLNVTKSKDLISFQRTYPTLSGRSKPLNRNVIITTEGGDTCFTKVVMDVLHGGITLSIEPNEEKISRSFQDKLPFGRKEAAPPFFTKFTFKTNNQKSFFKWIDNRLQKYMLNYVYPRNGKLKVEHSRLTYIEDSFIDDPQELRRFQHVMATLGIIAKKMEQGRR